VLPTPLRIRAMPRVEPSCMASPRCPSSSSTSTRSVPRAIPLTARPLVATSSFATATFRGKDASSKSSPRLTSYQPPALHRREPRGKGSLQFRQLHLGGRPFDPTRQPVSGQLLAELGACPEARIEAMKGCGGGLNQGIWLLSGAGEKELVLKLVRFDPLAPSQLVEAANLLKMQDEFPNIGSDDMLTFPSHIFHVLGPGGTRSRDLIVMRRAPGVLLADVVAERCRAGRVQELIGIFEKVGVSAAEFHHRYGGKQHCDLGPHNIFYEEETGRVTFIDLGGMGNKVAQQDVDRFAKIVCRISGFYGQNVEKGVGAFREGYAKTAARLRAEQP